MKVVVTDHPYQSLALAEAIFAENGFEMEVLQTHDQEIIVSRTKSADAILAGMARIDSRVIGNLDHCKVIVRMGVGYDTVDVAAATARGIPVVNIPDFCTEEVSDLAMAFIILIARRVLQGRKAVRDGKWGYRAIDFTGFKRINQQTLGIYGLGRIGKRVAAKARGFNIQCLACDPFRTKEAIAAEGVEKVEMDELLVRSDIITLHSPLTEETRYAFGLEQFRSMKRTAWIINTSRGPVIREEDLVKALDEKLIGGAALDVLTKEPPEKSYIDQLAARENLIITPHMGSWTWDAREDLQTKGAEEVVRALIGEAPKHVVNPEVLQSGGLRR